MKALPKVSVIVPAHEAHPVIAGCVASIRCQTVSDWEAIIVDDGSTDGTQEALRDSLADPRFRVILQPNGGVSVARNRGMDVARGDCLLFVDADDAIHASLLERTLPCLDWGGKNDFVLFMYDKVHEVPTGETLRHAVGHACPRLMESPLRDFFSKGMDWKTMSVWRFLFRREALGEVRFDVRYRLGEDIDFLCRALCAFSRGVCLSEPLYFYVQTPHSLTRHAEGDGNARMGWMVDYFAHLRQRLADTPGAFAVVRRTLLAKTVTMALNSLRRARMPNPDCLRERDETVRALFDRRLIALRDLSPRWWLRLLPTWLRTARLRGGGRCQAPRLTVVSVVRDWECFARCLRGNPYLAGSTFVAFDNAQENVPIPVRYNAFLDALPDDAEWILFAHEDFEPQGDPRPLLARCRRDRPYGLYGTRLLFGRAVLTVGQLEDSDREGGALHLNRPHPSCLRVGAVDAFDCCGFFVHADLFRRTGLRFDPACAWDLYAEDFCIRFRRSTGRRAAILPLTAHHWSRGDITTERFRATLRYLNGKFADACYAAGPCAQTVGRVSPRVKDWKALPRGERRFLRLIVPFFAGR